MRRADVRTHGGRGTRAGGSFEDKGFETAIDELLPELGDWTRTPPSYLYPGPQEPGYSTNRLSTASNDFRDRYHVRSILDAVQDGERAFVVAGSAHALMQEPALRAGIR